MSRSNRTHYDGFYISFIAVEDQHPFVQMIDDFLEQERVDETAVVTPNKALGECFFIMKGDQRHLFNESMTAVDAVRTFKRFAEANPDQTQLCHDADDWLAENAISVTEH